MIDASELVAAIKRVRGTGYGPSLHLLVPEPLPRELVDVLAQLDVKPVVWLGLVTGKCVLVNAEKKEQLWIDATKPEPFPPFDYKVVLPPWWE